jgi:hypothetical protein
MLLVNLMGQKSKPGWGWEGIVSKGERALWARWLRERVLTVAGVLGLQRWVGRGSWPTLMGFKLGTPAERWVGAFGWRWGKVPTCTLGYPVFYLGVGALLGSGD